MKNKKVLLFSGGLDSVCIEYLTSPDVLLYVDMETPVSYCERQRIQSTGYNYIIARIPEIKQFELTNKILPGRNAFFVLLAAQYGTEILLGSTAGDTTKDKDIPFTVYMTSLLLHMMELGKCPDDVDPEKYCVSVPFKAYTKAQLVTQYIQNSGDVTSLVRSYSCYAGTQIECGKCRACVRKYVALKYNDVDCSDTFINDPKDYIPELLKYSIEVDRDSLELQEIKYVASTTQ